MQNGFEEYQYQSGLPQEIFQNLYSRDNIKFVVDSVVKTMYNGGTVNIDSTEVRNRITENVNKYLADNQIVLKDVEQNNIDQFENMIVQVYEEKMDFLVGYTREISDVVQKITDMVRTAKLVAVVMLVFVLIFTLVINISAISDFFAVLGIALLASGTLLEIVKALINKYIHIDSILILNQSLSDFIKIIANELLTKVGFYGVLFIILGICGIIINGYLKGTRE